MIRLGIVGDIGSGKSYVAKKFGFPVFNADHEVANIYKKNQTCFKKIKKILPKYINSFPIKKNEIINSIIANKSNLKKITKIVHIEVKKNLNKFLKKNKNNNIVVLDIPLLLENKINKKNDILVFVDAKKKDIIKRLKKRKHFNFELLKRFKKIQLPLEYKKKKSQYIIKNNFNKRSLEKDVKSILKKIL
jgi:dephospho-CoA kinase